MVCVAVFVGVSVCDGVVVALVVAVDVGVAVAEGVMGTASTARYPLPAGAVESSVYPDPGFTLASYVVS